MKVERTISIARPPADVFRHMADVRNDPSWHTDVLEVTSSTDVVGMGTVFDVKVKPSMGVSKGTMTVTRLEPDRLIQFQGRMGKMALGASGLPTRCTKSSTGFFMASRSGCG